MSSGSKPLVSVLMTAYNRADSISFAIESVLASHYDNFELIIVDDASTDSTLQIAKKYEQQDQRVRVFVNEQNQGDYPNRNIAASYAKGKYLKYCDSDEYLYPYCLDIMVDCMEKFPEAAFGLSKIHNEKPLPIMLSPSAQYQQHYLGDGFFTNGPTSTIIRSDFFWQLSGFRPIRHRGDFDLWLRMGARFNCVLLPALLNWNYMHPGQESQKNHLYKASLTLNIAYEALLHSSCPLSVDQKKGAKKKLIKNYIAGHILGEIKRFHISNSLKLWVQGKILNKLLDQN